MKLESKVSEQSCVQRQRMVTPETRLQRVWSSMRSQLQGPKNLAFRNRPGLRIVGQPSTWSHLCRSLHCTLLGEEEHQPRHGPQAASTRAVPGESLAASTEGRGLCGSGLELLGVLAPVSLLSQKITLTLRQKDWDRVRFIFWIGPP